MKRLAPPAWGLAAVLAVLALCSAAAASFPGANGRIAFVREMLSKDQIFTVLPDGSGLVRLSSGSSSDRWPSWSGDGTRIAYQSCCRRGRWQIWTMSASGAGKVNTSSSTTSDTHPAFSRDGSRIAFVRNGQIWLMRSDGSAKTRLTGAAGFTDDAPSWSPDGSRIAFQRCCFPIPGSVSDGWQIFVTGVDASGQTNLSGTAEATSDFQPDWSPDGSSLVFARCICLTTADELYTMAAAGSGQLRLAPGVNGIAPRFSPDGARLVFWGPGSSGAMTLFTMASSGGAPVPITEGMDPAWQPR